jgi:hypothetical protein
MSAILGGALGLVAALLVTAWFHGERLPLVDRAALQAARQRWRQHGPASYDVEVAVDGPQSAVYRVEVRDGQVRAASIDGRPLRQQRTWGTWSVPGMFGTIESDLDRLEGGSGPSGGVPPRRVVLRGRFDERYGYPEKFLRVQGDPPLQVTWEVTRFEVIK